MLRPFPERQIKIFHIDPFRLLNGIKGFRNEPSGIHDSNPVSRLIQGKSFGARMHIMHKDPSFIRLLYPRKYSVDVHGIVQHAFKGTVADLYLSRTADEMRRVAVCGKHRAARTYLHPAYGYRVAQLGDDPHPIAVADSQTLDQGIPAVLQKYRAAMPDLRREDQAHSRFRGKLGILYPDLFSFHLIKAHIFIKGFLRFRDIIRSFSPSYDHRIMVGIIMPICIRKAEHPIPYIVSGIIGHPQAPVLSGISNHFRLHPHRFFRRKAQVLQPDIRTGKKRCADHYPMADKDASSAVQGKIPHILQKKRNTVIPAYIMVGNAYRTHGRFPGVQMIFSLRENQAVLLMFPAIQQCPPDIVAMILRQVKAFIIYHLNLPHVSRITHCPFYKAAFSALSLDPAHGQALHDIFLEENEDQGRRKDRKR